MEKAAADGAFDITARIWSEINTKIVGLRKGKMTDEQCREALSKGNYFGTMLVKMGKADSCWRRRDLLHSRPVRPALQLIKCKPGISS